MLEGDKSKGVVIGALGSWQGVKRGEGNQLIGDEGAGDNKM